MSLALGVIWFLFSHVNLYSGIVLTEKQRVREEGTISKVRLGQGWEDFISPEPSHLPYSFLEHFELGSFGQMERQLPGLLVFTVNVSVSAQSECSWEPGLQSPEQLLAHLLVAGLMNKIVVRIMCDSPLWWWWLQFPRLIWKQACRFMLLCLDYVLSLFLDEVSSMCSQGLSSLCLFRPSLTRQKMLWGYDQDLMRTLPWELFQEFLLIHSKMCTSFFLVSSYCSIYKILHLAKIGGILLGL